MDKIIRALVVDDSAFMRCAIGRVLNALDEVQVIGYAKTGAEGVEQARRLKPDLITLDIEMPEMDGLTALPRIKQACQATVLMVSSLTRAGSTATLTALRIGAADFISKDQSQISRNADQLGADLTAKVRGLFPRRRAGMAGAKPPPPTGVTPTVRWGSLQAVLIGSSTGGPPVLEQLIAALSSDFPAPVVIAQHMPAMFTRTMAERLDGLGSAKVLHVESMLPLQPGHVYVGVGGRHVRLTRRRGTTLWVESSDKPEDALYRPSVNELFASGAACCGAECLGIVLTGMGEDGLEGARDLHAAGAPIVAQAAATCVVYGMPRAVTDAGLIAAAMPPEAMARMLKAAPTLLAGRAGPAVPVARAGP